MPRAVRGTGDEARVLLADAVYQHKARYGGEAGGASSFDKAVVDDMVRVGRT